MSVEDRYYKINRILLKSIGLWPYQDSTWTRVQVTMTAIIYLSSIFVQLAVFITHECTADVLIKVFSFVFPSFFVLCMHQMYYLNSDMMKGIMRNMYADWTSIKNKVEFNIMNDYANFAKQFTEIFLYFLCICIIVTLMCHTPVILDIVSPMNVSRVKNLNLLVEYFVDPSKFYYILLPHLTIFITLGLITIISVAVTLYGYALHACALFKVANYRIEILMSKDVLRILSPEKERVLHDRLVCAVNIHRRAFLYCETLVTTMQNSFLIMILIGVVSLSINLFRFLKAITMSKEVIELSISSFLVFFHFCFLFILNHIGQQITNINVETFNMTYNLPWYTAPVNIQKLLLFLLQKCTRNYYLSISGMIDASYESFTTLSKLSVSYFTVLYAVQ